MLALAKGGMDVNYLRVRGEYCRKLPSICKILELPPRARRIQWQPSPDQGPGGTTSACAENTTETNNIDNDEGNYLRVRGEYISPRVAPIIREELPPRARRILAQKARISRRQGTTSACAENTSTSLTTPRRARNYLRVRGEYRC